MEDLRWILLLVGGLVVAAVYFSSRFEREDWVREREELDTRQRPQNRSQNHSQKHLQQRPQQRPQQKAPQQDLVKARVASEAPRPGAPSPRKEPQMSSLDVVTENSSEPDVSTAGMVAEQDPATLLDSAVGSTLDAAVDSTVNAAVNVGKDSAPDSIPDSTLDSEIGLRKTEALTDQQSSADLSEAEATTEQDATGQPKVVTAAAVSEKSVDAALPEAGVTTREKTGPAAQHSDDDVPVEDRLLASAIDAGIEDEITGVDIPFELTTAEAEIQIENHRRDTPEPTTQKIAPSMNIEPLVLVITVMAEEENFSGPAVREALEAEGLEYGEMRIFHYFDRDAGNASNNASNNEKPENIYPVFSVASLVEPGYFVLEKLQEMEMPGLTLFCQLPGSLPGEKAFEIMLDKGRGLAVRLHGQMCDDKHNRFTTQAKTHYQDRIATYTRKLAIARKKSGV